MLASLTIKNIVLIEQLQIDFKNGLCALTGETGAGKSILLDSLGLTLGARSNTALIRKNSEKAMVQSVFELTLDHPVMTFLTDNDIEVESILIFKRTLTRDGVSKAFINDQIISLALMKSAADMIAEVHGQFDNQKLFNSAEHINYLDEYGAYNNKTAVVTKSWKSLKSARQKMLEMKEKSLVIHDEEEYLRQSIHDLDALAPQAGEEEKLTQLKTTLKDSVNIVQSAQEASLKLEEMQTTALDVWRALQKIEHSAQNVIEGFERANTEIEEVINNLTDLVCDVDNNDQSLEEIDDRLFALKTQSRKHQCEIDDLAQKRDELANALDEIDNMEELYAHSIKQYEQEKINYLKEAQILSNKRKAAAKKLQENIMKELPALKLEKARFEISVTQHEEEKWSKNGIDKVEFLVATNPNSDAGALNKIASGGELARLTLALKAVFADTGNVQTLIFDEVDSGIGGATAAAVGERLSKLSQFKQILVVTHSPQVAAKADNQWIVSKSGTKDIITTIAPLKTNAERQEEIARMISGEEITPEARAAAMKLLEKKAA